MRIQHVGQDCYLYVDTDLLKLGPAPTTHSKIMWCVCCGGLHILRAVALPFCSNPACIPNPHDESLRYGMLREYVGERAEVMLAALAMGGVQACVALIEQWAQEGLHELAVPRLVRSE